MAPDRLISIVMGTYQGESYLSAQIQSILSQTCPDWELIISDDGSTDRTREIAKRFSDSDTRIRVFSNSERLGVRLNFLNALKQTRGDLLCFCDQDDVWRQDKLEILLQLLEQSPANMLAYSDLEVCDENLNPIYSSFWKMSAIRPVKGKLDERILFKNLTPGCSMMFRRAVAEKMVSLGSEAPLLHDHLAFITSCGMGKAVYTRKKLVKYRQHSRNVIGVGQRTLFIPDAFLAELKKRVEFLDKDLYFKKGFKFEKIMRFCDAYAEKKFWQLPYLGYYLFIHPCNWKGRAQAICKALTPRLYEAIKTRLGASGS
jgi:rhamnosyltransferase